MRVFFNYQKKKHVLHTLTTGTRGSGQTPSIVSHLINDDGQMIVDPTPQLFPFVHTIGLIMMVNLLIVDPSPTPICLELSPHLYV